MLARIRGNLTVDPTVATAFTFWCAMFCMDADEGSATYGSTTDPTALANLIDEDVLWWYSARFGARTVATSPDRLIIPLDIKTKRRLRDKHILLAMGVSNAAAGTQGTVTVNTRALLIGNATS